MQSGRRKQMASRAESTDSVSRLALLLARGQADIQRRLQEAEVKYNFDFLAGVPVQGAAPSRYIWTQVDSTQQEGQKQPSH